MLLIAGTKVGYRITELLTWTIGQVRTANGEVAREISVPRALLKGGSGVRKRSVRSRRVVLNERARGAIREYLGSLDYIPAPDEFLFKSREGGNRPLHRAQAHRILKRVGECCGIDVTRLSTHSLRKSFVRSVYDASGHDLIVTQRIVGHCSPTITARYLETTDAELDNLVLNLGKPNSETRAVAQPHAPPSATLHPESCTGGRLGAGPLRRGVKLHRSSGICTWDTYYCADDGLRLILVYRIKIGFVLRIACRGGISGEFFMLKTQRSAFVAGRAMACRSRWCGGLAANSDDM